MQAAARCEPSVCRSYFGCLSSGAVQSISLSEPIYGAALTASESPGVERNLQEGGNQVTVLVGRGAPGNYFDELKHLLLDYVLQCFARI